tara:strand:- start:114 stop:836 length:723 start_codon:yes stop_codon:yes gene_type:complete
MEQFNIKKKQVFKSLPFECSYIPSKKEQRLIVKLDREDKNQLYFNELMKRGFRRNLNHMYFPICSNCNSCMSSRIKIKDFKENKSQRRNIKSNTDLKFLENNKIEKEIRYKLFLKYSHSRHCNSQMRLMSFDEFNNFLYKSPVQNKVYDLIDENNTIIGVMLLDCLDHGLSAVYSFYDPDFIYKGLGTLMILKSVELTRELNLDYLYLGYWVSESKKMNYKATFKNLEIFQNSSWQLLKN